MTRQKVATDVLGPSEWLPVGEGVAALPVNPDLDLLLARLLATRGVEGEAERLEFLSPSVDQLKSPQLLKGLPEAVARLRLAAERGDRVAVLGDYDVDGITAAALTVAVLRAAGAKVVPFIPHRIRDGYGFSLAFVDRAKEAGCGLFVALDCGTNDRQSVEAALAAGLDVIVVDHHLPTTTLPAEVLLINPKQPGCEYPFKDLCAAGLALKLASELATARGVCIPSGALFRMASLGTIADMVPLLGENRVIATEGLRTLAQTPSPGLQALLKESRTGDPVTASDVGFRIGPRINAVGRMAEPQVALDLLLTRDAELAGRLASELDATNQQRRKVETEVFEEALEQVLQQATSEQPMPPFLVAWKEGWARGVLGIAAGRLARRFNRPCVLLAVEGGVAKGSGRSIPQIHLHDFLARWAEDFSTFGGHAQALGLSIEVSELERLYPLWLEAAAEWPPEALVKVRRYAARFSNLGGLEALYRRLESLAPFGMGNPEPMLVFEGLVGVSTRPFGNGHLEVRVRGQDGAEGSLLGWSWADRSGLFAGAVDVLGSVEWDSYKKRPTIKLIEARSSGQGS